MRRNRWIILLGAAALLALFFLLFQIHLRNEEKTLSQFKEHQSQLARQVSVQIESYLRSRSHDLRGLSAAAARPDRDGKRIKADILASAKHLSTVHIKEAALLDAKGTVAYSTTAEAGGENYAGSDFFAWAKDPVNRGKIWVGYAEADERGAPAASGGAVSPRFGISLVAPLYRDSADGRRQPNGIFSGLLLFKVDLAGMLADRSPMLLSLMKLRHLWIMDREGTVLLQADHPEMVKKNIRQRDATCHQCHASFDHVETMLWKAEGVTEYQLKNSPRKIASFVPMSFENTLWIVVVNAPLDEVTAFVREDLIMTLLLLALVVFVLSITFYLAYRNHRRTADQETAVNALLSLSLLDISLNDLLARLFERLVSLPWLKVEAKGCIFLVKETPAVLVMVVQRGLDPSLATLCAEVPFGRCLCGRAALTGEVEFAKSVDERHEHLSEGLSPHGHYCIPVKAQGRVLGVLNLYLQAGHGRDRREEAFLKAIADVLAGIIVRKQAEENIRESEARLHSVVENATDGIYQATADGHYLFVNKAFATMLGYASPEECRAAVVDIGQQIYAHPEKRIELMQIADREGIVKGFETEFHKKDGSRLWVSINMQPVFDARGRHLYYQGICEEITARKQLEEERQQGIDRLHKALGGTARAIASMVEARDPYTAGHQRRVADLARTIATEIGMEKERIEGLRIACMIHDIGKISVPAEILSKPTKLTELEFSLIKNHVQAGYEILKDIGFPWPVARMTLEHHEKMNGSGYPQGLSGERLLLESRILVVADVVEAITSHRPYRPGFGIDKALEEITKNRGSLYDPEVVDACLRIFHEKGYAIKE